MDFEYRVYFKIKMDIVYKFQTINALFYSLDIDVHVRTTIMKYTITRMVLLLMVGTKRLLTIKSLFRIRR